VTPRPEAVDGLLLPVYRELIQRVSTFYGVRNVDQDTPNAMAGC
jgi:hypothetical protein